MRLRVCSGMERAAEELFRTAETVPGVRPRCFATDFNVTAPRALEWGAFVDVILSGPVSDFPAVECARRNFWPKTSHLSEVGSQMNGGSILTRNA